MDKALGDKLIDDTLAHIKAKDEETAKLRQKIIEMASVITSQAVTIVVLSSQLEEKDKEIAHLKNQVKLKHQGYLEMCNKVKELERQLEEYKCPTPELKGTYPVVLYFENDKDRQEFTDLVASEMPNASFKQL